VEVTMHRVCRIAGPIVVLLAMVAGRPAFAQIDLQGTQFITSTHFKREPDGSKWMPTPCESSRGTN
jgi:hypothetical protein